MVGLDPKQIIEIRDLIKSLSEKHTVILSSHILSEVSAVCDHIMIIAHGKLVASDTPEGLKKLMSGAAEVDLTVKGSFEALKKALEKDELISKVETVENLGSEEEGCVNVKIICKENTDIRETLYFTLAQAGLVIMKLNYVEKSLEDIFLELTGPEDAESAVETAEVQKEEE
jgi:ABC-2 type transport system ATP-binding protein